MKIAVQEMRSATPPFELEYETRQDSAGFLQSLSENSDAKYKIDSNIDFFYMAGAYEAIDQWLSKQKNKAVAVQKMNSKIREQVFFIWYEITDATDPISMFKKVNLGKIPLTNAELTKALLLNKENFDGATEKRQIEISLAWDRIEHGLRDDSFWYFLNENEKSGTRIDMLFDLISSDLNISQELNVPNDEQYFSFSVFLKYFKERRVQGTQPSEIVKDIWDKVENLYAEFRYWYEDLEKYHLLGYLIICGISIEEILKITSGKRKSEVISQLYKKTKDIAGKVELEDLKSLFYGTSYKNKVIRNTLLLFNIATIICKSDKQHRFPFDIYKNNKWDIEHIHATADVNDELNENDESDDCLHNLAILDSKTNKSYKNSPFDVKRSKILEYESKGLFVPLCTKNVFLKVYTKNITNMERWEDNDKLDYIEAISKVLNDFFKEV